MAGTAEPRWSAGAAEHREVAGAAEPRESAGTAVAQALLVALAVAFEQGSRQARPGQVVRPCKHL